MAENVYFSCLDDPGFSTNTKAKLADDLIALWDSGTDPRSIHHLMALSSLWSARDSSPPSFGTMDGITELLRISFDMGSETEWEEFLKEESTNDHDPRAIYDFFIERRDACTLRKRVSAPGPLHTIEEIYLKYRIILEAS